MLIVLNERERIRGNSKNMNAGYLWMSALIAGVGFLVMIAMLTSCAGLAGGLN